MMWGATDRLGAKILRPQRDVEIADARGQPASCSMMVMRCALVLLVCSAVGCRTISNPSPVVRANELARLLIDSGCRYEVRMQELVYEPDPKVLRPILKRYECDFDALECSFSGSDTNARIFALHALSESPCAGSNELFAKWVQRIVEEKNHLLKVVSLWYVHHLSVPAAVPLATIVELLDTRDRPVWRGAVLALRNQTLLPRFGDSGSVPFEFFELMMRQFNDADRESQVLSEIVDWTQEVLEDMTTMRSRRGEKVIAAIPLPEAGPLRIPASQEPVQRAVHWGCWWKKYKDYLAWVPLRVRVEHWSFMYWSLTLPHRAPFEGGGFFILDSEALKEGVPTSKHREAHAWGDSEGPAAPQWYERGRTSEDR